MFITSDYRFLVEILTYGEYVDENVDHNFDFWRKFFGEKCDFGNNFNFLLKYVYQKILKIIHSKTSSDQTFRFRPLIFEIFNTFAFS